MSNPNNINNFNRSRAYLALTGVRGLDELPAINAIRRHKEAQKTVLQTSVKNNIRGNDLMAAFSSKLQNSTPNIVLDFRAGYNNDEYFYITMNNDTVKYKKLIDNRKVIDINLDDDKIKLNNKESIPFDKIKRIQSEWSLVDQIKRMIERCMKNDNFKESFKKEYETNRMLHHLKYPTYSRAIRSFGDVSSMDEPLKRKLASASQIMANHHTNTIIKKSLENLANQYHWAWKRRGGTHHKKRSLRNKRTRRNTK